MLLLSLLLLQLLLLLLLLKLLLEEVLVLLVQLLLLQNGGSKLRVNQELLCLEHVQRHALLENVKLLGRDYGRHLYGDLNRGSLLLLLFLLLLKLLHCGHDRVSRLLYLPTDDDDPSLRVDRAKSLFVVCTAPLVEEVREHVAMVADKEGVRHVSQLLRVLAGQMEGGGDLICDDVIHVFGPT